MLTTKEVTGNLFNFYSEMCSFPGFSKGETEGIPWVRSDKNAWPEYILSGREISEELIDTLENGIINDEIPSFWIREETSRTIRQGITLIDY